MSKPSPFPLMKSTQILAGTLLALAAGLLFTGRPTDAPAGTPALEARSSAKFRHRPSAAEAAARRPAPPAEDPEAANLAAWSERFDALLAEHGDRPTAIGALLAEIDTCYLDWVSGQLEPVTGMPPAARYDELSDIAISVDAGTAAIFEQLGIDESQRPGVTDGAAERVVAEIQYAEAAPDSASRLALHRLDREREARLESALAQADEVARSQAVAELDAWYEAGMGGIFAAPDEE